MLKMVQELKSMDGQLRLMYSDCGRQPNPDESVRCSGREFPSVVKAS
jgi:hypothetical protein